MKIVGLITEYNPFHQGHLHHINMSKKVASADGVICVMSGNFIQRGEPAIFDKWARAKMGILGGADLVIEMPVVYSMSSAEFFAFAGVSLLNSTGIVDSICFGSEIGTVDELKSIADILNNEPEEYKMLLKEYLEEGISYPSAREKALTTYFNKTEIFSDKINEIVSLPNNILGIEYIKALQKLKSVIKPYTIKRLGNNYRDKEFSKGFSSATAIRESILQSGVTEEMATAVPDSTLRIIHEEIEAGRGPVFTESYDNVVLALLRRSGKEYIGNMPYMGEGLHNRLYKALQESSSINELVDKICTKRYTRTRVSRGIMHSMTGLTGDEFNTFNSSGGPRYIRVLALNSKGRQMLSSMKKKASLPVIVKTADYDSILDKSGKRMFEIEAASTDMYVLGYPSYKKTMGQEFTRNVVTIGL